jgi:protein disulfide-isomerase A6
VLTETIDCKNLAPIWEDLAKDFSTEPGVLIAKVDAEAENSKALATEQGVQSYPTIKWFKKGSTEPSPYDDPRTIGDFVNFINANSGTHRTPGGGLDVTGGTIEALDTIVSKFKGAYATGADDVKKAAEGLKDKYAQYSVKVFDKISKNEGYAEKEFKRLQGLIGKGNLAQEKLDDLTSRSNILRRFLSGTDDEEEKSEL